MKIRERSAALSRQLLLGPGGPDVAEQHTMRLLHALNIDGQPGGMAAGRDHPFLREFAQDFPQGVAAPGMHAGDWANEFAEVSRPVFPPLLPCTCLFPPLVAQLAPCVSAA